MHKGSPKQQINEPPSTSQGQFVYQLQLIHAHPWEPEERSFGIAVYIGKGLFLTASHNLHRVPGREPKQGGLYVIPGEGKDEQQVEAVGFMDPEITPLNGFIRRGDKPQVKMDIALLKIREGDPPDSSRAANPYIIADDDSAWIGAPKLRFWGINPSASIEDQGYSYPDIDRDKLQKALNELQVGAVSTSGGNGSFGPDSSDSKADFITYDISTSAGASGSAITTDSLDQPKLLGIHRGFRPGPNVNCAVNLNTPRFREFFTRCTAEMVEKDPEEFSDWEWMKMRAE
ncbi:hypothetical protein FN846DRAFT_969021 [Sphaerosporella brunnea]|uniref:Serine protease n=1 Tax=Sphaerosporella brunnea TaxID=1250544 RepID=A0A5J5EKH7_9PEZI|nr:hypothetical protein FN846DRAFT_969021 [Sphaerosporella brunnea]